MNIVNTAEKGSNLLIAINQSGVNCELPITYQFIQSLKTSNNLWIFYLLIMRTKSQQKSTIFQQR